MTKTISRRTVLRAAAVSMALPALECMESSAQETQRPPMRMIAINFELSFHPPNLIPETSGPDYQLPKYLQPLADLRDQFTMISGTSHPEVDGGHSASVSWLTGAPHPGAANFKNSISLDQLAATHIGPHTRFASRQLGAGIAINSNGVKLPGSPYPVSHFNDMFLEGRPEEKATQVERLRQGRSILDTVSEASRRMQQRVSQNDRHKLQEYFSSVRDAERSLQKAESWHRRPKPVVDEKPPTPVRNRAMIRERNEQMYDIMRLALQTDSTRLMTYVVNDSIHVPQLPGISQNYHNLSHHGQDPGKLKQLAIIESEYLKSFGSFLRKLNETREGEASLLDRTMIVFGSHMHDGNHNNRNLPILFAGGGFNHGRHLAFDKDNNTPLSNLFVSMIQRLEIPVDKFASSTGPLQGLS